jgi:monothiol glutaredoxin
MTRERRAGIFSHDTDCAACSRAATWRGSNEPLPVNFLDASPARLYNPATIHSGIVFAMNIQDVIKEQLSQNRVVLYMKGSPDFPQCGFSANAVGILHACGVENFLSVNVLENPDIREGIKQYANWPTVPQLYVNGEFVGGSDIMGEMFEKGELQQLLK